MDIVFLDAVDDGGEDLLDVSRTVEVHEMER